LTDKKSRAKEQIQKIEEQVKKMKEKQIHDNEEYIQTLVEKLVKKEEDFMGKQISLSSYFIQNIKKDMNRR